MNEELQKAIMMAQHFWEDKGDPSRSSDWPLVLKAFPHVKRVYMDWRHAEKMLGLVLDQLGGEA